MLFKDLYIEQNIKDSLIKAAQNGRIPHAQMFLGDEGRGALSLALAYAQFINCENPKENDSCGQCKSCKKFQKLTHPDLHFVFPVIKTNKISKPFSSDFIQQWREFVLESKFHSLEQWLNKLNSPDAQPAIYAHEAEQIISTLSYKAFEAKYKTMIIWLPEKMNLAAANKLLKILEEPPERTVFILVSHDDENILPTIKSRTQILKIPPLSPELIIQALEEEFPDIDKQILKQAAKAAEGNFISAKKFVKQQILNEQNNFFDLFVKFMRLAYKANPIEALKFIEELAKLTKEQQKQFINYSLHLLRQTFLLNFKKNEQVSLTDQELQFALKFKQFINLNNIELLNLEFSKALSDLERNAYSRILFLDLLFTTTKLIKNK